ncbi:hypothetical protein PybrP1_006933 [[Pythium] brassicae (nom. inval.)]|nr:hypothetical protein PybrP1_006933 [[Pythium] brassicae (nom. inval.)]
MGRRDADGDADAHLGEYTYDAHDTPLQLDGSDANTISGGAGAPDTASRHTDRHTIVDMSLRSARFMVLVVFALAAAFSYATITKGKLELTKVYTNGAAATSAGFLADVKTQLSNYNALFGTVMFAGSKVFEVYTETFICPTLHTYLHNCSLYPGDAPQRVHSKVKANAIFWGLKSILIFMNVGFASLYVGQASVAASSSSSRRRLDALAVSAAEIDALVSRSPAAAWGLSASAAGAVSVRDTVLRSAVDGVTAPFDADGAAAARCRGPTRSADALLLDELDATSVALGFPVHEWSAGAGAGVGAARSLRFSLGELTGDSGARIAQQATRAFGVGIATTARELAAQGVAVLHAALGESTPPLRFPAATDSFVAVVEQSVSVVNATLAAAVGRLGDVKLSFAALELAEDVSMVSMTIDVSVPVGSAAEVLCGSRSSECVASHRPDARLRPEVSILPYAGGGGDGAAKGEKHAAFVFGLGRSVTGGRASSAVSGPVPLEMVLSLAFAKLVWAPTPLHVRHGAECAADDASRCVGLSVPVSSPAGDGVVLVSRDALPRDHLSASSSHPLRLVTLSSVSLPGPRGSFVTWDRISGARPTGSGEGCAGALVDAFAQHVAENRLSLETPLHAMSTSVLLYLLQNGVFTEFADERGGAVAVSRELLLAATPDEARVEIEVGIPTSSSIATFAGCGVMVLLMLLVVFFPTARVKLSPNTTPAAQYVQILTDDLYPDIVHKKRIRFANGDGLLFNEYVVDAIVLHAKRNEKKKIYL